MVGHFNSTLTNEGGIKNYKSRKCIKSMGVKEMNNNKIKIGLRPLATVFIIGTLLISTLIFPIDAEQGTVEEKAGTLYATTYYFNFMQDIREALTGIILENINLYWRGRAFGTPGEDQAAVILKDFWDLEIARDGIIPEAEYDDIEGSEFTNKIDVQSQQDYNLEIHLENDDINIPYLECFPVHTKYVSEDNPVKIHNFQNAEVLKVPEVIYSLLEIIPDVAEFEEVANYFELETTNISRNISENVEAFQEYLISLGYEDIFCEELGYYENLVGEIGEPLSTTKFIYLIEISRCRNFPIYNTMGDYCYTLIVPLLRFLFLGTAFLLADRHQDTYFMPLLVRQSLPGITINGSIGTQIKQNMEDYGDCSVTADFYLKSSYIDNVVSKNVIGTIPGEVDEIVIVGAHYDSVWCQGAADDSGSVSVVWGIAKYIADKYENITPYYTLKFAAWAGEDYGRMGSESYVSQYSDEQTFVHCINAAAFGYVNDTDITKEDTRFHVYSLGTFPEELQDLIEEIDYTQLSGGYGGVDILDDSDMVDATDAGSFRGHVLGGIFSFDKGDYSTAGHWLHRSGEEHTKGDILDIIDVTEINAAAKVVLTTVIYFATTEYVNNG